MQTVISPAELAAIEPRSLHRSQAIDTLVSRVGLDRAKLETMTDFCLQLRYRREMVKLDGSGYKVTIVPDAVMEYPEPRNAVLESVS